MKKLILSLVATSICLVSQAENKSQNIKSEIKKVTIFLEGATVTRTSKVALNPGTTQLIFEEVTTQFDPSSIQAAAGSDVTILSVSYQAKKFNPEDKSARQLRLEDSISSLEYMLQLENINKTSLEEQLALITTNKKVSGSNGLNVVQLADALDLYKESLPEIKKDHLESTRKYNEISTELNKKRQQLNQLIREQRKPFYEILVTVSTNARRTANIEVSYYCANAGWLPKYDIRATDLKSTIELNYKADVLQNTGEDWDDVQITLSSGNPRMAGNMPTLNPNYVYTYDPNAKSRTINQNNSYVFRNSTSAPADANTEDVSMTFNKGLLSKSLPTQTREYPLTVEFDIKSLSSVKSGNRPSQVDIDAFELDAIYKHASVPKLDRDAFLEAKVVNWEGLNLLSGDANIYFEGRYIGRSFIDAHTNNDTLNLSLGRDKKVVIKRTKVVDKSSRSILGGKKKQNVNWEIEIKNTKNVPVEIVIYDQIPLSKNSDIEITLIEKSGADYDEKTGQLTWRLKIAPGESVKVNFEFEIKHPKNVNVRGTYTL